MALFTFKKAPVAYMNGRRVNAEEWNGITRTKRDAGTLAFGVPVKAGSGAHTCTIITDAAENVLGVTEASQVLPHTGDRYAQYDNVAICTAGVIGVIVGDSVVAGAQARFNLSTGKWTDAAASATIQTIPGCTFDESGAANAVVPLRVRMPNPALTAET